MENKHSPPPKKGDFISQHKGPLPAQNPSKRVCRKGYFFMVLSPLFIGVPRREKWQNTPVGVSRWGGVLCRNTLLGVSLAAGTPQWGVSAAEHPRWVCPAQEHSRWGCPGGRTTPQGVALRRNTPAGGGLAAEHPHWGWPCAGTPPLGVHTEMELLFPESGFIGLHAVNMTIGSILVNGEPAEFEHFQHCWLAEDEKRWCSVSCSATAADAACSTYMSSLDKEMTPNLFISCCKTVDTPNDRDHLANGGDQSQNTREKTIPIGHTDPALNQNLKLVRINYQVDVAGSGIHFGSNLLFTDNQIRRARCWFPSMDSSSQCCCYDLEFTVDSNLVAVSNGDLLYQILNKDDPSRKTYVYKLNVPISACWISLAIAPFEVLPDSHNGLLSHLSLTQDFSKLRNTVGFFNSAFSHYEDYLSASFPFRSYKQVFIPPESSVSLVNLGASMCIFPSNLLFDEKVIDQTIQTRIKLAYALARQWFGVYVVGETPNDEWIKKGLCAVVRLLNIELAVMFSALEITSLLKREEDTINHLFVGCSYARVVWEAVADSTQGVIPQDGDVGCFMSTDRQHPYELDMYCASNIGFQVGVSLMKANCAVCKADVSGATALSSSAAAKDLHGTQNLGLLGKIRSWKAVAILQMLEKQMGPESFRKVSGLYSGHITCYYVYVL
ncbi:hypothetical protein Taro_015000 [Colocasia esculenta]|uniref:Transcription initiation factor TFIID subunit 2 n=1 Tax=Colocasia esculenta TaxID=4460 RepID=A0A843UG62_COLES|nr:hypothetical protein [Colocasia esculenta]